MSKTIGSLFAGIGGFDLGFEREGFQTTWAVEIDQKAQAVLRRNFPSAALHDDVREVGAHNLAPVDVVTFGSPCQDLSVAGKRAGLAGERSGLFHESARIIRELRERYGKPDFAIWENVVGAFSSNAGRDFAAVVQAMVDIGARDVAWRVLDSRFAGVAQRRRRIFLVADFGGERAAEVLALTESVRGHPAKGPKARQGAAQGAGEGAGGGRGYRMRAFGDYADDETASTMKQRDHKDATDLVALTPTTKFITMQPTAGTLDASYYKGSGSRAGAEREFVAHAPAIAMSPPIGFYANEGSHGMGNNTDISPSLKIGSGTGAVPPAIAFHPTQDPISAVERTHALSCGSKTGQSSIAAMIPQVSGTLGGGSGQRGWSNDLDRSVYGLDPTSSSIGAGQEIAPTLRGAGVGGNAGHHAGVVVPAAAIVRRLTPVECCRLQGFPDNWNTWGINKDGKRVEMADSSRYKQLGNAVTVNVAQRIAARVAAVLATSFAPAPSSQAD